MNYKDFTIDDAYKYSIFFEFICDGDRKEITIIKKDELDKFVETINNIVKGIAETLSEVAKAIVETFGEELKNFEKDLINGTSKIEPKGLFNEKEVHGKVLIDTDKQ